MKKLAIFFASLAVSAGGAFAQGQFDSGAGILQFQSFAPVFLARPTNDLANPFPVADATATADSVAKGKFSPDLKSPSEYPLWVDPFIDGLGIPAVWEDDSAASEAGSAGNTDYAAGPVDYSSMSSQDQTLWGGNPGWIEDSAYMAPISTESNAGLAAAQTIPWQDQVGGNSATGAGKANDSGGASVPSARQADDVDDWADASSPHRVIASPEPNTIALTLIGGLLFGWWRFARRRGFPA
jgi:hypothetical protein